MNGAQDPNEFDLIRMGIESPKKTNLDWLENVKFYSLCQQYRHMPVDKPREVLAAFAELKGYILKQVETIVREHDEYALLIFQPCGETHHNANKCPYCQENKENL